MKKQDTSENLVNLAYLAIGSNLGNKINNIETTKFELERHKIEIAVAKGKKQYDKRETKKNRDWNRDKARYIRKSS